MRGAIALAQSGLEFVVAPVRTTEGRALLRLSAGALSCTPWLDGEAVGSGAITDVTTARANLTDLARLHGARPHGLPRWSPLVKADFAEGMAARLDRAWDTGPYGERARRALTGS